MDVSVGAVRCVNSAAAAVVSPVANDIADCFFRCQLQLSFFFLQISIHLEPNQHCVTLRDGYAVHINTLILERVEEPLETRSGGSIVAREWAKALEFSVFDLDESGCVNPGTMQKARVLEGT